MRIYGGIPVGGNLLATTPPNMGGVPNAPIDRKLLEKLQQQGTPPPPGFREQYVPGGQPPLQAGNPFGSDFRIQQRPGQLPSQPVMPGENREGINNVYGRPGPVPMMSPSQPMLPQAYGNGMGVYGSSTPMGNAGFFLGPQLGQQLPAGFQNKMVS